MSVQLPSIFNYHLLRDMPLELRTFFLAVFSSVILVSGCDTFTSGRDRPELFRQGTDLGSRMHVSEAPASRFVGPSGERSYRTVADIDPPQVEETSTSAIDLYVKGSYVYVAYTMPGEAFGGGVDRFKRTKPTETDEVSGIVTSYLDVSALSQGTGNLVYVAGALAPDVAWKNLNAETPAVLASVDFNKLKDSRLVDLASSMTTDVEASSGTVHALTGADGGRYYELPADLREVPEGSSFEDARSIAVSSDYIYVLDGAGVVHRRAAGAGSFEAFKDVSGDLQEATIANISYDDGRLYAARNANGFVILDADTGDVLASRENGWYTSLTTDGNYVYAANGDAGVRVLEWLSEGALKDHGVVEMDSFQANLVVAVDNHLYVANGERGVRILKIEHCESK